MTEVLPAQPELPSTASLTPVASGTDASAACSATSDFNLTNVGSIVEFEFKYKLGRTLGKGSFAQVKLCAQRSTNVKYAVKIITKKALTTKDKLSLANEVQIVTSVSHPNIVQVIEVFASDNSVNIVMECMSGGELFDRIVRKNVFSEQEAKVAFLQVMAALKYCHSKNIAHRDLKPENLLYQHGGDDSPLKLADFGLARMVSEDEMLHNVCGTPGYVAPEVLEASPSYGVAVDMWSAGIVLYILLCGYPPFYDDDNHKLFQKIRRGKFEFKEKSWKHISQEAKDLIKSLLVVSPTQRLSAVEVLAHPWCSTQVGSSETLEDYMGNLHSFNAKRRLKRAIRMVYFTQVLSTQAGRSEKGNFSDKSIGFTESEKSDTCH
jgi:calcium/calmodulin-dependent protein kinase I